MTLLRAPSVVLAAGLLTGSAASGAIISGDSGIIFQQNAPGEPIAVDLGPTGLLSQLAGGQPFEHGFRINDSLGNEIGSGVLAATITPAGIVSMSFGVINTMDVAQNYDFEFFSAVPSTDPATGRASTTVTLLDRLGDGATLSGLLGGNAMVEYRSAITGGFNTGALFASHGTSTITAGAFETTESPFATPGAPGFIALANPTPTIGARVSYTLSPQDQATFNGSFVVIPNTGVMATLGVAGLLAGGRRRRVQG